MIVRANIRALSLLFANKLLTFNLVSIQVLSFQYDSRGLEGSVAKSALTYMETNSEALHVVAVRNYVS